MKKSYMILILVLCLGCNETVKKPNVKPLTDQIMPARQDWKDGYGDTLETQLAFNVALIRYDQKQIFKYIQSLHAVDPNEVPIEDRVEKLETVVAEELVQHGNLLLETWKKVKDKSNTPNAKVMLMMGDIIESIEKLKAWTHDPDAIEYR